MSILDNAVDSISLGIEDFKSSDSRRLLSSVRNLVAGVLLLFKHRLSELSPKGSDEALIKEDVQPINLGGTISWRGVGKKTVTVHEMERRCQALNIRIDWKRVKKINDHRNDIEHYHSPLSQAAVRGLITECFVVIRDFVRDELKVDPLELFDSNVWNEFTQVAEVFQKEKDECTKHIQSMNWRYGDLEDALVDCTCPKCGSKLMDTDPSCPDRDSAKFTCLSCGEVFDFETTADHAMGEFFSLRNFRSLKDGGEEEVIDCPNCRKFGYHLADNVCVICEEEVDRECSLCGNEIPSCELDGDDGMCSGCSNALSKDD
jgi:predicted RNA-binding Zn-ribbon protein involved in translation (DUF1610 family)